MCTCTCLCPVYSSFFLFILYNSLVELFVYPSSLIPSFLFTRPLTPSILSSHPPSKFVFILVSTNPSFFRLSPHILPLTTQPHVLSSLLSFRISFRFNPVLLCFSLTVSHSFYLSAFLFINLTLNPHLSWYSSSLLHSLTSVHYTSFLFQRCFYFSSIVLVLKSRVFSLNCVVLQRHRGH